MPNTPALSGNAACVGYLRRSTDLQDHSLDDQRAVIKLYAAQHNLDIQEWYIDDAISGTSAKGREAFRALIEDAQSADLRFSRILVYDITRFGRMDPDETGYYRHLLRQSGVEVVYVAEPLGDTPEDELIRSVKQWLARQESRDKARVSIRGWLSKMSSQRGWWMGGTEPYGYDRRYEDREGRFLHVVRTMPDRTRRVLDRWGRTERTLRSQERLVRGSSDRCKLVLSSADRVAVVQRIFDEYVSNGLGAPAIASRLNDDRIPAPRIGRRRDGFGGSGWTYASVRGILGNPIYTGDMVWNRRTSGKLFRIDPKGEVPRPTRESATLRWNPREQWLTVRAAHPAIISRQMFEEVTEIVTARAAPSRRASPEARMARESPSEYTLTGLTTCGVCGERVFGIGVHRMYYDRRRTPYRARVYACRKNDRRGKDECCWALYVRRRILESAVSKRVAAWYRSRLTPQGRARVRNLAAEHCQRVSESCGGGSGHRRGRTAARHVEQSVLRFMEGLPGFFEQPNKHKRRLAFARCIDRVRLHLEDRRADVWVRRLPIAGARAGGLVRLTVPLPVPSGPDGLGPRKRDRVEQKYTAEWHVRRQPTGTRELLDRLRETVRAFGTDVHEVCRQQYLAFAVQRHFAMIKARRGCLLVYLKLDFGTIPESQRVCSMRDVRDVGTQTTGTLELTVDCTDALNEALPWVRRSYEQVNAACHTG